MAGSEKLRPIYLEKTSRKKATSNKYSSSTLLLNFVSRL